MDVLVKNVPDSIGKTIIDFNSIDELLDLYLDFQIHSIDELPEEVKNAYNNFSEENLVDLEEKYGDK